MIYYTLAFSFHSCLEYSRKEGSNRGGCVWGRLLPLRYIGMWAWYLRCFGLKTGIDFVYFRVWSRLKFSKELPEFMNVFVISIPNE